MIPRFTRKEMADVWTDDNRFRIWLEIELLACEAQAEIGVIPAAAPARIRAAASFDAARIDEIEKEVRHDVIAFLTNVGEYVGEESRHIHLGMTSSDVIDTGFSVQLRQAADLIVSGIDRVSTALARRAREHRDTPCIGRSHGIHAEPTSFGLKLAGHYAAFRRARARILAAREEISVCAISGAVGSFATIDPRVQEYVARKLGLKPEDVSTQVIPRDRHAAFFSALALLACVIENLAVEIRHLQRTELREAEEYFSPGQKGSSAMPHKRNPILSENLTGLARLIRAAAAPALENVTLWHERDISHSSVERVAAPDATILADFALHRLAGVVENLVVHPARMRRNMESTCGLVFSQSVLIALAQAGMPREEAYKIVQSHALAVWDGEDGADFRARIEADPAVRGKLDAAALDGIFSYERFLERTGPVLDRALHDT